MTDQYVDQAELSTTAHMVVCLVDSKPRLVLPFCPSVSTLHLSLLALQELFHHKFPSFTICTAITSIIHTNGEGTICLPSQVGAVELVVVQYLKHSNYSNWALHPSILQYREDLRDHITFSHN